MFRLLKQTLLCVYVEITASGSPLTGVKLPQVSSSGNFVVVPLTR